MQGIAQFSSIPWEQGGHPLERKKVSSTGLVLLEFAPGFADPNWCRRSHVIYVIEGTLSLELRDGVVAISAGDAFALASGVEHRAANHGECRVVSFVASDIAPIPPSGTGAG